jgi:tetratricopeptide (TPR) repeat protein
VCFGRYNLIGLEMSRFILSLAAALVLITAVGARAAGAAEDLLRDVQKLLAAGDFVTAEQKLQAGMQTFPNDPRLANALGIVSAQRGDLASAEKHFRNAVELAPRFTDGFLNLGRLYQQAPPPLGSLEKAIGAYDSIAGFDPSNVEANYQLAVLLVRQGSYQKSQTHLSRLPEQAQQRAQAISVRCANLAGLGDEAGAKQAAQKLVVAPDLSEPDVTGILPVLLSFGKTEAAVVLLEGLSAKNMGTPANLRQLGLLYEKQGDLDRARATLEKAAPGFQ